MSVFRIHKTRNYTVMSNHHFKERGMSLKAKGLLSLMLSLPDDWNYSVSGLVTLSKDGKDSVMSALQELEEFNYLNRTRLTNDKGQFAGIQYDIFEEPQPQKPIAELPISAKQDEDLPISEEPTQLNTNSINNLSTNELKELNKNIERILISSVDDNNLIELYKDYIEMRKDIGSPLSPRALKILIARNERLSKNNVRIQKLLLENATLNEWKNIYLPNESELDAANNGFKEDFKDLFGLED